MSERRGSRFVDLVRTVGTLRPRDPDTQGRIAALLGFADPEAPRQEEEPPEWDTEVDKKRNEMQDPARRPDVPPPSHPGLTRTTEPYVRDPKVPPRRVLLTPDRTHAPEPPAWLENVLPLDPPPTTYTPPQTPEPLLLRRWTRSVLSGALAQPSDDGAVDVEGLVSLLSSGAPVLSLPTLSRPTMARGVQVLVDLSELMLPWMADQSWLIDRIRRVAGAGHLEVLQFDGIPSVGAGLDVRWEWTSYHEHHTPHAGATVVAITDLGAGISDVRAREARAAEWRQWAIRVRTAACAPIAFVPYKMSRYPPSLHRVLPVVQLDLATSVRTVRRVLGRERLSGRASS